MDADKLRMWADLLLDTGKRNNLINFKDTKTGSVEIVAPDFDTLFSKAEHGAKFEVYDPKLDDEDDEEEKGAERLSKSAFTALYEKKLKKSGQVLLYNPFHPFRALRNIGKRAKTAIEETGVNIAYMAFGFIRWSESSSPEETYRAPILLAPIAIENESAIEPYSIKITDGDLIVNPTFSFKLKNEYGIDLPKYDDEGADAYFEKLEGLISKLKWSIAREVRIGIFSFLKINMYEDLKENTAQILRNEGVRALLGSAPIDSSGETGVGATEVGADGLYSVVDADASQTEAIEMARSGKSFVLQGPPGTGKSQTITNIIAQRLADGKKVLFVSEKLAALSVVYDKLKKAGLEEFCLELHSHKANKKEVIEELCRTLKAQRRAVSDRAQKTVDETRRLCAELDEYADELYKTRAVVHKSLYELYGEVATCRNAPDAEFAIGGLQEKGEAYIERAEIALRRFVEYIPSIGYEYRKNGWYGFSDTDDSYEETLRFKADLENAVYFCERLRGVQTALYENYGIAVKNMRQVYSLREWLALTVESGFVTPALLHDSVRANALTAIRALRGQAKEILDMQKRLDGEFDGNIYNLNGEAIFKRLTELFDGVFKRLFGGAYKRTVQAIRACKKDGGRISYAYAVEIMDTLRAYQRKMQSFAVAEGKVKDLFGYAYNGVDTDFDGLIADLEKVTKLRGLGLEFGRLPKIGKEEFFERKADFERLHGDLENAFSEFEESVKRVEEKFDCKEYDLRGADLERLAEKYRGCLENFDKLEYFREFWKLIGELSALDLRKFVDYAIHKNVPASEIVSAYKKAFYSQWINLALRESPVFIKLPRVLHDDAIQRFKEKDLDGFEINKAKIKAKLSVERPNLEMIAPGSAVAVLLRENEKKRKQKGVRTLLEEIGDLVQTLKPCFLMSPLSVSTFLSADIKFDTVVFDEASQIFPQDAVGAIYRGKQLIVVGDSKQMPPSNFFTASAVQEESEEEIEDITDFESILDICSTAFPQKRLQWHYRSRFESLIAFSNEHFYGNDLVTFPSSNADDSGIGVEYEFVDGVFDRNTKTNRAEADRIVDLVFEHIDEYPKRSLGVVAFSISQQNLIEKLLAKRRRQDPSKEWFFKSDRDEPFFVKNLETVQGDERDTILFSVAYGRDEAGRLLLNFGPINREGGERRLNVAFTRAKYNIRLVSSMHATDIDLSRTQSVGARLLKAYLSYAENGGRSFSNLEERENAFERNDGALQAEIAEFLGSKGFEVDREVGRSAYKIDLAVKYLNADDYAIAIECDGANYRASKTTRDRERLRQEVLERMGWKFYRVWSTDWFRNKRVEKEKLLEVVRLAVENAERLLKGDGRTHRKEGEFEEIAEVKKFAFPRYYLADEQKTAEKYENDIWTVIRAIVALESPISEEWLLKRIAFLFGREKVTSVVREKFNLVMRGCTQYGIIRKNGFLYAQGKAIPMLRVPQENAETLREIKYIPLEELANGMKEVLKQNITVDKNGLFRLLVQRLGFTRIGDAVLERLDSALNLLSNEIETDGDTLTWKLDGAWKNCEKDYK